MLHCKYCNSDYDSDLITHLKSSWHGYNLRRSTQLLAPVSLEVYEKDKETYFKKVTCPVIQKDFFCCGRKFNSEGTYKNHQKSKGHAIKLDKYELQKSMKKEVEVIESDVESFDSNEEYNEGDMIVEYEEDSEESFEESDEESSEESDCEELLTMNDCLFCNEKCTSVQKCLNHMYNSHGFRLPHSDYITDLEGLMSYLAELVSKDNVCLKCNKQFDDIQATRNHMIDKNHNSLFFNVDLDGDDLVDYYEGVPKPIEFEDDGFMATLPSGKKVVNRLYSTYLNQKLNVFNKNKPLSIEAAKQQEKCVLARSLHYGQVVKSTKENRIMQNKTQKLASRNQQYRESRFKNIQTYFRDSNMIY